MTNEASSPSLPLTITRNGIDTAVATAWNAAGVRRNLLPLAWWLGNGTDGVHFIGNADAYAPELRRDIVESWIAELGLTDHLDLTDTPLRRSGSDLIWTGTVDGTCFQLSYPANADDTDEP